MKLGTRGKRILVVLALMPMMVLLGKAQPNIALYPLENQFNSFIYNPAFLTSQEKFSFSIFPIGGASISYNNKSIIERFVSNIISKKITDNDYQEVLKKLADRSSFNENIESALLNFTLRSKVGFFNFRIKESEYFSILVKGDVTDFIIKTGIQSASINKLQDLPAQAAHYREYSIGYSSQNWRNNFTFGVRAKMYFGKSSFFSGISGAINNESGNYVLRTTGKAYISIPQSEGVTNSVSLFTGSNTIKYLMNTGNPGFGVDLGFKYRITSDLSFSMSVIDLGKINWKTNLNSKSFNSQYKFPPGTVTYNAGNGTITKNKSNGSFIDSISSKFDLVVDSKAFSRPLPITAYAGLKYRFSSSLKISLTDRYVILENMNYNSFLVSASFDLSKKISVNTGYAIIGDLYDNIPLALLFNRSFGQIYVGTDNLMSIILPSSSGFAGITFGACFYLFKKRNQLNSESDEYPFYRHRKIRNSNKTGLILKEFPES